MGSKQSKPKPKPNPWFFDHTIPNYDFTPNMRIFLESGGLGEFLILGYGKKWNFHGGAKT